MTKNYELEMQRVQIIHSIIIKPMLDAFNNVHNKDNLW